MSNELFVGDGGGVMAPSSNEPMEQEYTLNCKIIVKKKSYKDEQSQGSLGNMTREVVLLDPIESSETYRFFDAWMGSPDKRVEVLLRFDHPFKQYARACIMHPKALDAESELEVHHLFLMSYGLSQMIIQKESLARGKIFGRFRKPSEVLVTVCKSSDDHPDGCPTDGTGPGDDLYSGTRREVKTGFETAEPPIPGLDRHGRPPNQLKG